MVTHASKHTTFVRSLRAASLGVADCIARERNMKIHVLAAHLVVSFTLFAQLGWLINSLFLLCIALVFTAETLNTALESAIDLHISGFDAKVKRAKDASAGAVLVLSVFSALLFVLAIFYNPQALQAEVLTLFGTFAALNGVLLVNALFRRNKSSIILISAGASLLLLSLHRHNPMALALLVIWGMAYFSAYRERRHG